MANDGAIASHSLREGRDMNLRKLLLAATFVAATAVTGAAATAAQADTFTVFTGYADNLRASGFFPTTWLGDAGVVSESSAAQSFDSGAIRHSITYRCGDRLENHKGGASWLRRNHHGDGSTVRLRRNGLKAQCGERKRGR